MIEALVANEDNRYPRFGGMCWVFLRSPTVCNLINWTDSLPMCSIDKKSLLAPWSSTDVDAHDAAGVFGNHEGRNQLLSLGVILKPDLEELFLHVPLDERDRNRTGYTSALYMAWKTDAVVVKVSEHRKITIFSSGPQQSAVRLGEFSHALSSRLSV